VAAARARRYSTPNGAPLEVTGTALHPEGGGAGLQQGSLARHLSLPPVRGQQQAQEEAPGFRPAK
jgi:hypothetical protein